jgi:UDP-GlcNAc:undecaprenyl-phosphate/decaprenyl-phosphate GlcNAc-1-phosphate transferase
MPGFTDNPFLIGATAFLVSIAVTYAVRSAAHRFGFVAKPKADRWHQRPTAMMGGVAIFLTTIIISLLFVPQNQNSLIILGSSSFLFVVGLIDDILHIKPYQKLIGQFIGVAIIVVSGLALPWTDSQFINIGITAFWLIGITNAINLLDNMDGLAGGISAIAATALAMGFYGSNQFSEVLLISVFIGALIGFLIYNFNPASIFMGDCGSLFVGFFLASSVLMTEAGGRSRSIIPILAVPALILFVPIFDTTFVTILRKLRGRKASQGGRDHTSHRLVALGLSERAAVLMLYGFAILAGLLSLLVREMEAARSLALIALFVVVLTLVGVYLSKVKVYEEQDEAAALQNNAVFGFLLTLSHKRRIFEVILDSQLITLSYYGAYALLFGSFENTGDWEIFLKSLPILIVMNLFAFLAVGVYRGIWRYTSVRDFITFAKGVALGSILSLLAILILYRFQNFSRAVFIVTAILLFMAIAGSRLAFRLFRQILPMPREGRGYRNVLIYGAGDGGELVLRELYNNPEWDYAPIGFLDDDPLKTGKVIHGLRVFGSNGSLLDICKTNGVEEILIASRKIQPEKIKEIREICLSADISLKRALLKIEPVDFE